LKSFAANKNSLVPKGEHSVSSYTERLNLPWYKRHARTWMGAALMLSDVFSLALSGGLALLVRRAWESEWHRPSLEMFALITVACLALFGLRGLYPGIGTSPVSEIRSLVVTSSAASLGLAALTFFAPSLSHFPRLSLGLFWLFCLVFLPSSRILVRYSLSRLPAWGEPVILFGGGARTRFVYEHLKKRRMLGFDPVLTSAQEETLPLDLQQPWIELEKLLEEPEIMRRAGIKTALVAANSIPEPLRARLLNLQGNIFERLIKIPDQHDLGSLGVSVLDLDGVFAYEVRQNLASRPKRAFKRLLDLSLTVTGGLLILPFLFMIALLVKMSSPGPAFYRQTRVGKRGQNFQAWKFRTMVANAEELLDKTIRENPGMRAEWESNQKLKQDPRITSIGRFLRKYSLDELPQIWNVLRGEMSLVGPRPCLEEQIPFYGDDFDLYKAVQPGITGLWQVSGRNGTTYAERVRLDTYYVRNWSVWMDVYILLKTFWVVIKHDGAY
jgi:Undecaprenyl-phosphate galactose phosphotransferase WbaP